MSSGSAAGGERARLPNLDIQHDPEPAPKRVAEHVQKHSKTVVGGHKSGKEKVQEMKLSRQSASSATKDQKVRSITSLRLSTTEDLTQ
jgi:hypothetical protein